MIPTARVESNRLPTGQRIEILVPRQRQAFLHRLLPEARRWHRYRLDRGASRIFELIDGRRSVADLVDIHAERYPDDTLQLESRVLGLLHQLEQHGFVEIKQI